MSRAKPLKTAITEMLGMDYPIIQAPMFLVSDVKMVTASVNAGGMGSFPALNYRPISKYESVLKEINNQSSGPYGVNVIVQKSNKSMQQQLDLALDAEVPVIITSLGSPKDVIKAAQGTKTKVFCDVVGLTHAKKVEDLGADALIAVGSGAGGHAGDLSPFALIPYLKKSTQLPIIAAGCMNDGASLLAARALGADAIYMGTRMIASKEAQVRAEYKESIVKSSCEDIVNTDKVDGFPGNFIKTPLLEKVLKTSVFEELASTNKKFKRWISLLRAGKALFGGDNQKFSYKNIFSAGHGVGNIHSVVSIDEIIQTTMAEYYSLTKEFND